MSERIDLRTGSSFEVMRGFSRAVVVDNTLYLSATSSLLPSGVVEGGEDPYEQMRAVLRRVKTILNEADFELSDLVQTTIYVRNLNRFYNNYSRAYREFFPDIRPSSSIVQVESFADVRVLVEMSGVAIRSISRTTVRNI